MINLVLEPEKKRKHIQKELETSKCIVLYKNKELVIFAVETFYTRHLNNILCPDSKTDGVFDYTFEIKVIR